MIRRTLSIALGLLLPGLLLLPTPAASQSGDRGRGGVTSPGARQEMSRLEDGNEGQVFLGAFRTILEYHRTTFSDSLLWEQALNGLLQGLNDPYATVFTAEEFGAFQEENTGEYAGIGVQITRLNERVTITAVFRQTPAAEAGLMVGDRIVVVGETDARDWSVDQARDSIRGPAGTQVVLTVDRQGLPGPLTFPIRRQNVHVPSVTASMVHDSLGYIQVDRMAEGSSSEVDSALLVLRDAKGIILDLRRNPGGPMVESLYMADLFLERGKTLAAMRSRTPGRANATTDESWAGRTSPRIPGKPMIVLVDGFTASAAEIVAGALQDHERAVVVGERTFGKGVVQTILPLPGDRRIRITTGDWMTPLGRSLHIPRDLDGRPLAPSVQPQPDGSPGPTMQTEGGERVPSVVTAGGRVLRADGGVYPDLVVADDTLSTAEQNLLVESARAGVPLTLRIAEFSFEQSRMASEEGRARELAPGAFEGFLESLRAEGVPGEVLDHSSAQAYLRWRVRMSFADRLGDNQLALEAQAERDTVLAEAIRLLEEAGSQADLFATVDRESARALSLQAPALSSASTGGGG